MSEDKALDVLQAFACYQCINRKGKEPCEYLPKGNELCTHYKWRYEQIVDNYVRKEQTDVRN